MNQLIANNQAFQVEDIRMNRASGYGHYNISVHLISENGNKHHFEYGTTDSQLFDDWNDDRDNQLLIDAIEYRVGLSLDRD